MIFQRKILLPVQERSSLPLKEKPRPVIKVEVNGKIVFDREGRREVVEDVLPKDGDV